MYHCGGGFAHLPRKASSLMFKPMNLSKKNNKPVQKPKPTFASVPKFPNTSSGTGPPASSSPGAPSPQPSTGPSTQQPQPTPQSQQKRGYQDWLAKEDEEEIYQQRPRYAPKKAKKNKAGNQRPWSFDDQYNPGDPVLWAQYQGSEDFHAMNAAWMRRLETAKAQHQGWSSTGNYPTTGSREFHERSHSLDLTLAVPPPGMQFPPPGMQSQPSNMQFQPPQSYAPRSDHSSDPVSRSGSLVPSSERDSGFENRFDDDIRPSFAAAELKMDESGDDAFARRQALSAQPRHPNGPSPAAYTASTPNVPMPQNARPPANSPPARAPLSAEDEEKRAKVAAQIAAIKARSAGKNAGTSAVPQNPPPPPSSSPPAALATPPPPPPPAEPARPTSSGGVISGAPTFNPEWLALKAREEAAKAAKAAREEKASAAESETPQSKAKRMMEKMGYEEGKGLGATGEGITTALKVQAEKRKKKSDAQGGGFATPAAMGKIVGGKKTNKTNADDDGGPHGRMSAVVKFEGMLKGMDVDKAIQDEGILQEIGDEMAEFGKVERLKIWRDHEGGNDEVFIKFTSQLSALRAINAMDGAEFEGNTIQARYWDDEKFEAGQYA